MTINELIDQLTGPGVNREAEAFVYDTEFGKVPIQYIEWDDQCPIIVGE